MRRSAGTPLRLKYIRQRSRSVLKCAGRAGAATALSAGEMWAEEVVRPFQSGVDDDRISRSVLECASPLALFLRRKINNFHWIKHLTVSCKLRFRCKLAVNVSGRRCNVIFVNKRMLAKAFPNIASNDR
jgi:hypothetical protein